MGLRVMRAAVCVTLVVLVSASSAVGGPAAFGATPVDDIVAPAPIDAPNGSYIVLLEEDPAAVYDGGIAGLAPTMAAEGETFDAHSPQVSEYIEHLRERQGDVAAKAGIEPSATYQVVLNGFSAQLSPEAAARVAAADGVLAVHPDEIFRPDAASADQRGAAPGGVRQNHAAASGDGEGVVVGVIDTGIAPENPAFAGERLRAVRGPDPYLAGNTVVFDKGDGHQFRSARVTADGWGKTQYSTKLIGAQYFSAGAEDSGFSFANDVLSPVDSDGHGSGVASVAAGNAGVRATVDGVDLGAVSGVAPAAKIASYKACFVGHDPEATTDDVCVGSDLLAAVDRAVADGVDVIDYSIGAAAAASPWAPADLAFHHAAAAGVFVSVSAGNAGPGPSTVQAGAPWYTTVAAATVRAFEGTVQLSTGFAAPGVSVSVPPGAPVTAPVVYAGDAALAGSADAELCYLGTLDPAAVQGRIVVCDRGTNPRVEKSQEVRDAGGVGMILVNTTPDSLDADMHRVPTVHIDAAFRADLLAGLASDPGATATLVGENLLGEGIPVPQIAAFSGRGPLAGGEDVLSPDVAAPGVGILAAEADGAEGEPTWGISSGTSLAAPHVAGLAALYLAGNPSARPDEIKSALMTTASRTLEADGSASVDPFAQGAGHVDAARVSDPGLLYRSGPDEWAEYLASRLDGSATAGTDLNVASIVVPALGQEASVTRTLTATRAGTYRVAADIPGVDVSVSPSTLAFAGPGDTQEYTVAFRNESAPVEVWATGLLTWTGEDGTSVRSPLAVLPASADATALVSGDGTAGSAEVSIVSGVTGALSLDVAGLTPIELLVDPDEPAPGHSGDASSGDENGKIAWILDVPAGSPLARFTIQGSEEAELDLAVYRVASPTDLGYYERWASVPRAAGRQITLIDPTEGSYLVVADVGGTPAGSTWDLTAAIVDPRATGSLVADPASLIATAGEDARYTLRWDGLENDAEYLGVVRYGTSGVRTIVEVDAGAVAPTADDAPTITGKGEVGALLRVEPGEWTPSEVIFSYQWLRDGEPIRGATGLDYRVREADVGTSLSVEVTAAERGNVNFGVAVSEEVIVNTGSTVAVTMDPYRGTTAQQYAVSVEVTTAGGEPATGAVSVWVDAEMFTGILADGRVTFALPAQASGIHVVVAEYAGDVGINGATGISGFVVD